MATEHPNEFLTAISTTVIALFTIILAYSTVKLWRAGERHAERELRAYVFVTECNIKNVGIGLVPDAGITVKNTGQTPAYRTRAISNIVYSDYPLGGDADIPELQFTAVAAQITLGPGMMLFPQHGPGRALTEDEFTAIISGAGALFIIGRIHYIDAFGRPRNSHFRMEFGKENMERGTGDVSGCPEGNDSD